MGTAVYLDESGVIDMSNPNNQEGQDVRFYCSQSWVSWLQPEDFNDDSSEYIVECLDGSTGFAIPFDATANDLTVEVTAKSLSLISTTALVESFLEIDSLLENQLLLQQTEHCVESTALQRPFLLPELRRLKTSISGPYEAAKSRLLTKHPVLRDWTRREDQHNTPPQNGL